MALSAAHLAVVALLLLAAAGCDGFITTTSRFGGSISISLDGDNIILPSSSSSSSIAAHRNFHSMGE